MALKETNRKVTVPQSSIRVNRGGANLQGAQTVASTSLSGAINSFLNSKVATLKAAEQQKGEQLGKAAELVYENFTDENGNTFQVATSYATPENLITTSWAASKFEEEAGKTLLTGLMKGVKEIVDAEGDTVKGSININSSVAEIKQAYRNKLSVPLDIIKENVPEELMNVYEMKKEEIIQSNISEIANKHIRMSDTYNNAMARSTMSQALEQMTTLSYTDPDRANQLYEDTRDDLTMLAAKSSVEAQTLLETKLRSLEAQKKLGFNLRKYTTSDLSFENVDMIRVMANNLPGLQQLLNEGPGSTVTLTNTETGKQEKVSFESLGISEDDVFVSGEEMRQSFSRLSSLLKAKVEGTTKDARILKDVGMSFALSGRYLTSDSDIRYYSEQIENPSTNISRDAIARFNAEPGNEDMNLTEFNFGTNPSVMAKYYTFIASNTGVLPRSYKQFIEGNLENNFTSERLLRGMVEDAKWQVASSAVIKPTGNTSIVTDVLSSTGLSEKAEKRALILRDSINLYGVDEGIRLFIKKMEDTPDDLFNLKEVAAYKGYNTIQEYREKVRTKILEYYGDTLFSIKSDAMISNRFLKAVGDDVLRTTQYGKDFNLDSAVNSALLKIEKAGNYGYSTVSIGSVMNTLSDDIDLADGMPSYIQFPPDAYIKTEGQKNLIQSKLDSVNRQLTSVIDNRYIDDDEQLQLGKNVFLQIIGKPSKLETAQYRFVFANNDGTDQRILVDNALNTISVSIPELMEARDE